MRLAKSSAAIVLLDDSTLGRWLIRRVWNVKLVPTWQAQGPLPVWTALSVRSPVPRARPAVVRARAESTTITLECQSARFVRSALIKATAMQLLV